MKEDVLIAVGLLLFFGGFFFRRLAFRSDTRQKPTRAIDANQDESTEKDDA